MRSPSKRKWLSTTLLVGSAATLAFAVAPIDIDRLDVSFAIAAGGQGNGNGGNGKGFGGGGRGGSGGGSSGAETSDSDHGSTDHESSDHGSSDRGGSDRGESGAPRGARSGGKSEGGSSPSISAWTPPKGGSSGKPTTVTRGGSGGKPATAGRPAVSTADDDSDSDRPEWAGVPGGPKAGGGKPDSASDMKGDLYGDLWVIARYDDGTPALITSDGTPVGLTEIDGVPTLVEVDEFGNPVLVDGEPIVIEGTPTVWVQPIDADGNLIALDEEGMPVDESLVQEVEIGRLNSARAPSQVLRTREDEVISTLNAATAITTDAAGRLVLTIDGEEKTIDSPLENLAIYVALLTEGTIQGVGDLPGDEFDFLIDGTFTIEDLEASTAFLAAATDKSGTLTADQIAYIDAFLGIETQTVDSVTYADIDYSSFTYDREDTYSGVMTDVLVLEDGVWIEKSVDVYLAVFGGVDDGGAGTLDAYTLAADDARAVIDYVHEYAIPENLSGTGVN